MRRGNKQWSNGVVEYWSNGFPITPSLHYSITPPRRRRAAFALYEVLIGLTIFVVGVLALGRAVENCMNANALSEQEERVRQILANRMAELQATPGQPDASKENKIETGFGQMKLTQKAAPAGLKNEKDIELSGITLVTLTAEWKRNSAAQSRKIVFYVYRSG